MKDYLEFMSGALHSKIVNSIVVVIISILLYRVIAYFLSVINKSMTGEDIFIDNGEKLKSNFIW